MSRTRGVNLESSCAGSVARASGDDARIRMPALGLADLVSMVGALPCQGKRSIDGRRQRGRLPMRGVKTLVQFPRVRPDFVIKVNAAALVSVGQSLQTDLSGECDENQLARFQMSGGAASTVMSSCFVGWSNAIERACSAMPLGQECVAPYLASPRMGQRAAESCTRI